MRDTSELFGELRSLLNQPCLNVKGRRRLWQVISAIARQSPQMYREECVPYVTSFESTHLKHALETFSRFEDVVEAVEIAPYALFDLNLSGLHDRLDLDRVLSNQACNNVVSLRLESNELTQEQVQKFAEASNFAALSSLSLGFNELSDESVATVAGSSTLERLTHLELFRSKVGRRGLEALAKMKSLESLNLSFNPIGVEGAALLTQVDGFVSLTRLYLGGTEPSAQGIKLLASSHLVNALKSLDLSSNKVGSGGVRALVKSDLASLEELDLSSNRIRDDGVAILAQSSLAKRLKVLRLGINRIGPEGAALIAGSMDSLELLSLYACKIRDGGAQAIANSPCMAQLRALDVRDNFIEPQGKRVLMESPYLTGVPREMLDFPTL